MLKDEYISSGLLDAFVLGTETDALIYQIPGGMLSNLISQLKAANAMDKLEDVLQETPRVRKDLGYPPLVTPMSQIVGSQATTNVMLGERYKTISKEAISYVRGEYGRSPGPIDPDLLKKVLGDEPPFTGRFADTLEPYYEQAKQEIGPLAQSEEDVLSYVAFPQIARKFLAEREERRAVRATYTIRRVEE